MPLEPGDPVPWFFGRTPSTPAFGLSFLAGRVVVLSYIGSGGLPPSRQVIEGFHRHADCFDGIDAVHYLITADPADVGRLTEQAPQFGVFLDLDRKIGQLLGVFAPGPDGRPRLKAASFVLDPALRVLQVLPIHDPATHADVVTAAVRAARPMASGPTLNAGLAPVLIIERVLEPTLCASLIAHYDAGRPAPSGVMRNLTDGSSTLIQDRDRKRRKDLILSDPTLLGAVQARLQRRVAPELYKAFHFQATRIERFIIGCYEADDQSFFQAHRDNSGGATAHRKFACSLNLNGDYEGGDLCFPEYGRQRYRPPTGGAVVFSCSLLHEVQPITVGRRLCVLPFLYDEAGEALRQKHTGGGRAS